MPSDNDDDVMKHTWLGLFQEHSQGVQHSTQLEEHACIKAKLQSQKTYQDMKLNKKLFRSLKNNSNREKK